MLQSHFATEKDVIIGCQLRVLIRQINPSIVAESGRCHDFLVTSSEILVDQARAVEWLAQIAVLESYDRNRKNIPPLGYPNEDRCQISLDCVIDINFIEQS